VKITFFQCNALDNDQRFRIVTVGGVPNYTSYIPSGSIGFLEDANGKGLSIPNGSLTNSGTPTPVNQSDFDDSQKVQMVRNPSNPITYLIQKSGSNFSLSSNTLDYVTANQSGLATTMYQSGFGRWQNFGLVDIGGGWYSIKYQWNPNYCLSSLPISNSSAGGTVIILPCNTSNNSQKWRFRIQITDSYEAWMVAKPVQNVNLPFDRSNGDVGHGWFSIIRTSQTSGPVNMSWQYSVSTTSAWPSFSNPNSWTDNSTDIDATKWLLGINPSYTPFSSAVRKVKISATRANTLRQNYYGPTGCQLYGVSPVNSSWCTCIDQATRLWGSLTGENQFKPNDIYVSPNVVYIKINTTNSTSGVYANNGNIIP
jgi:hypothetical protein